MGSPSFGHAESAEKQGPQAASQVAVAAATEPLAAAEAPAAASGKSPAVTVVAPSNMFDTIRLRLNGVEYRRNALSGYAAFAEAAEKIRAEDGEFKRLAEAYKARVKRGRLVEIGGWGAYIAGLGLMFGGYSEAVDGDWTQFYIGTGIALLSCIPVGMGTFELNNPPTDLVDYLNSHY